MPILGFQDALALRTAVDAGAMALLTRFPRLDGRPLLIFNVLGVCDQPQQQRSAQPAWLVTFCICAGVRRARWHGRHMRRGSPSSRLRSCTLASPVSTGMRLSPLQLLAELEHVLVCRDDKIYSVLHSQRYYKPFYSQCFKSEAVDPEQPHLRSRDRTALTAEPATPDPGARSGAGRFFNLVHTVQYWIPNSGQ